MPRFRTSIVLAMVLVTVYFRFSRDNGLRLLKVNLGYTSNDWGFRVDPANVTTVPAQEEPPAKQYATFEEEYEALRLNGSADLIFGNTLNHLVDADECSAPSLEAVGPNDSPTGFENTRLCRYNPYPKYNSNEWTSRNVGSYVQCDGPDGPMADMLVFSGHSKALANPPMGSNQELDINSNLCFERKTRLGQYGYVDNDGDNFMQQVVGVSRIRNWDNVNWGRLQKQCFKKNDGRYRKAGTNMTNEGIRKEDVRDVVEVKPRPGTRSAVLLRAYTGMDFTDDEKQYIRAMVTELSLKSGGEYEVFLLVQLKDNNFDIAKSKSAYQDAIRTYIPKEFWDMSVLWTDTKMQELYPLIPDEYQNVHRSQWFSVQQFAQEHPAFDYYWNWELDSRYTGHYYDLLEKLARFGAAQPRKGLWERNNRYYIPKFHGAYNTTFRKQVEKIHGPSSVWDAPAVPKVTPIGPSPPSDRERDDYSWGVGEEADYISLAPIFNPQTSGWIDQNMMSGYQGWENTPRRTTIGTQSRCSKQLLDIMHKENQRGNFVSSEMTPQTVAFHHRLKAVYAPIPMWFDREWDPRNLNKWFNPGQKGDSGGGGNASPFSWGGEGKFSGSTWYYRAVSPMRLWNNFLGWEDTGVGGSEWEKAHGRSCLPSMLLHPIKDVKKPPPGYVSTSPLPY